MDYTVFYPDISVIIPCYNHGRYLGEAIESVLMQQGAEIEIIVVDDGSTDETSEVTARYHPLVKYLRQPNSGPAKARNTGLNEARGEFVAFLDADDRWLPGFAEAMKEGILTSRADVMACGWRYIDQQGNPIGYPAKVGLTKITTADLLLQNRFVVHAALMRREKALKVSGVAPKLPDYVNSEDWHFWIRMALSGAGIVALGKTLVEYRLLEEGRFHKDPHRTQRSGLAVLSSIFEHAVLSPEIKALTNQAYGLFYAHSAAGFYAIGDRLEGDSAICTAVRLYPPVLRDPGVYYAIACAHQPKPYRSAPEYLDMVRAERDLRSAVQSALSVEELGSQYRQIAWIQSSRCLANLAFLAGDTLRARAYLARLLWGGWRQCSKQDLKLSIKALIGARNWQRLQHNRGRASLGD